jgi:hypothetical protein
MSGASTVARLENDMQWVKKSLEEITPKINNMHDTFIAGEGKIKVLNKAIFGNGKPGLIDKVNCLESQRDKIVGAGVFTKWLIGVLSAMNLGSLVVLINYLFGGK